MRSDPYLAAEDSALLREALKACHGETCLEIGAGNGGNLVNLAGRFELVVGTDLVRPEMEDWRKEADYLLADGASCFRDACFDLVAFNPPYLKEGNAGDRSVEGGENLEVPKKFLASALRVVRPDGRIVMLLDGDAAVDDFELMVSEHGFSLRKLATRHLFFEELAVYGASAVDEERSRH